MFFNAEPKDALDWFDLSAYSTEVIMARERYMFFFVRSFVLWIVKHRCRETDTTERILLNMYRPIETVELKKKWFFHVDGFRFFLSFFSLSLWKDDVKTTNRCDRRTPLNKNIYRNKVELTSLLFTHQNHRNLYKWSWKYSFSDYYSMILWVRVEWSDIKFELRHAENFWFWIAYSARLIRSNHNTK